MSKIILAFNETLRRITGDVTFVADRATGLVIRTTKHFILSLHRQRMYIYLDTSRKSGVKHPCINLTYRVVHVTRSLKVSKLLNLKFSQPSGFKPVFLISLRHFRFVRKWRHLRYSKWTVPFFVSFSDSSNYFERFVFVPWKLMVFWDI